MGMFDVVKSSYDLGEGFTNVECQTKDIDSFGGTMSFYWIDPVGNLWTGDYRGTAEPEFNEEGRFPILKWIPTGKHGKVRRHYLTSYVVIYPSVDRLVDMRLHFKKGVLTDFEKINNMVSNLL